MNIIFIGMRGAGKTTVAKRVAQTLGRPFIEMDDRIVQKAGKPIAQIVREHGWDFFRNIESEVVSEVSTKENVVISAGGGVVTRPENIEKLKKNGLIILLQASIDELLARIGDDPRRPYVSGKKTRREDMEQMLRERESLYLTSADEIIDTNSKTVDQVIDEALTRCVKLPHPGGEIARHLRKITKGSAKNMITGKTTICCAIGNPIGHSMSPTMHNAGFEALALDYVFLRFKVEDVEGAIRGMKALGIKGMAVTIPHKPAVMPFLDEIDEAARRIGAVNTIVNHNGRLFGSNTDYIAAIRALKDVTNLKGKKVILLGAGGAARGILFGLQKEGAHTLVLNRTRQKADEIAKEFGADAGDLTRIFEIAQSDILIHTTPTGMQPNVHESLVPKKLLRQGLVVFDIVYNPKETKLLQDAKIKGCKVVYGYKMFLYQGVAQFELFTGQKAPIATMEKALLNALGNI